MGATQTKRRRGCTRWQGAKAVRGVDRGVAAMLFNRRKKICRTCPEKTGCYVANQAPAFRERMHQRNGIEGTISGLARAGMRRTRYKGLAKTRLGNYMLGAGCNVKRWLRRLAWEWKNAEIAV